MNQTAPKTMYAAIPAAIARKREFAGSMSAAKNIQSPTNSGCIRPFYALVL